MNDIEKMKISVIVRLSLELILEQISEYFQDFQYQILCEGPKEMNSRTNEGKQ